MKKTYKQIKTTYVYLITSIFLFALVFLGILISLSLNQDNKSYTINEENKLTETYTSQIMQMIKQEIIEYTANLNSNIKMQSEDISVESMILDEKFLRRYVPIHPNQQILKTSMVDGESQNEYFFVIKLADVDLNNIVSFYLAYANSNNWELISKEKNLMDLVNFETEYGSLNISMIDFSQDSEINGTIVVLRIVELDGIG